MIKHHVVRAVCVLVLSSFSLWGNSAHYGWGFELSPMLSTALVGTYEQGRFRGELGAHFFLLGYLRQAFGGAGGPDSDYTSPVIYKAVLSGQFTPWQNHRLYGGLGVLCLVEHHYDNNYFLGVGPAIQYAWKFPKKHMELNLDLLVPLLYKHSYERTPDDDFPDEGAFTGIMLLLTAPTVGISWTW